MSSHMDHISALFGPLQEELAEESALQTKLAALEHTAKERLLPFKAQTTQLLALRPIDLPRFFAQHAVLDFCQQLFEARRSIAEELRTLVAATRVHEDADSNAHVHVRFPGLVREAERFENSFAGDCIYYALVRWYFDALLRTLFPLERVDVVAASREQLARYDPGTVSFRVVSRETLQQVSEHHVHALLPLLKDVYEWLERLEPGTVRSYDQIDRNMYHEYLGALIRLSHALDEYSTTLVIQVASASKVSSTDCGGKAPSSNIPSDCPLYRAQYSVPLANKQLIILIQQGFETLDLKNDLLRKRFDGLKYCSKRVTLVVYDLTIRGLIETPVEFV